MSWFSRKPKQDERPSQQLLRNPSPAQPKEKTVDDYANDFSRIYDSWKSKSDILSDVAEINRVGASLRKTKGKQFCRSIVEALSLRSSEHAQALASAWKVDWDDKGSRPTTPAKFAVGDEVQVNTTIDPGYGSIVSAKFENGSWFYWVQRGDKPSSWSPAKTNESWLTKA